jgi:hypothetical protein
MKLDAKTKPTDGARQGVGLEPGFWVAPSLAPGAAPLRSYVGQIEAVDERGVRVTLIDWLVGAATDWDLFVPWASITSALVATQAHAMDRFGDAAGQWQTRMGGLGGEAPDRNGGASP